MTHSFKTVAGVCGRLVLAGGITAMLFTAAVLPAAADEAAATRLVSTAGLDLTHAQGKAALVQQIHAAARQVCRDDGPVGTAGMAQQSACAEQAFSAAMQQVRRVEARAAAASLVASASR